jgi:hypothetical protein
MLHLPLNSAFQPSTPITIRYRYHQCPFSYFLVFIQNFLFFSMKVLSYGRKRCVILEAVVHDNNCVLANTLAAHYVCSSDSSRATSLLLAAKSHLVSSCFVLSQNLILLKIELSVKWLMFELVNAS